MEVIIILFLSSSIYNVIQFYTTKDAKADLELSEKELLREELRNIELIKKNAELSDHIEVYEQVHQLNKEKFNEVQTRLVTETARNYTLESELSVLEHEGLLEIQEQEEDFNEVMEEMDKIEDMAISDSLIDELHEIYKDEIQEQEEEIIDNMNEQLLYFLQEQGKL